MTWLDDRMGRIGRMGDLPSATVRDIILMDNSHKKSTDTEDESGDVETELSRDMSEN
jgi:hypothetical protein